MQYFGSSYNLNSYEATICLGRNNIPKEKIHVIQFRCLFSFSTFLLPNKSVHSIIH